MKSNSYKSRHDGLIWCVTLINCQKVHHVNYCLCDANWFRQDIKKPCHVKAIPNALEVQRLVKYLTFVMTKYELKFLNAIPLGQSFNTFRYWGHHKSYSLYVGNWLIYSWHPITLITSMTLNIFGLFSLRNCYSIHNCYSIEESTRWREAFQMV